MSEFDLSEKILNDYPHEMIYVEDVKEFINELKKIIDKKANSCFSFTHIAGNDLKDKIDKLAGDYFKGEKSK